MRTRRFALLTATGLTSVGLLLPAAAANAAAPVSKLDAAYLKSSAAADLAEISLGKVAVAKGVSPEVTAYAHKLITDHTKALKDARIIAKALHLSLPNAPTPAQRQVAKLVAAQSGHAFDVAYLKAEVAGHIVNIAVGQTEAKEGTNPRIRGNAKMSGPMLRYHLWLGVKDLKTITR